MAKQEINIWFVIAAIAVAYFLFVGNPFAAEVAEEGVPLVGSGGCNVEDISLYAKMTRLGKAGTAITSDTWYIITDSIGAINGGTAQTVPTNKQLQIMFGENSSTYYTVVKTINTGCQDPRYEAIALAYADTSLNSFYIKNSDGTVNSYSNNQSLGIDDTFDATVCIKAGSDQYFGNPNSDCQNVGVVQYDKTYILKVEGDTPTTVPGAFVADTSSYDGDNAFIIPKVGDGAEECFNVAIKSTGSAFDTTAEDSQPNITLYDCDVDKNEDTLELIEGVEDEDQNVIALAQQTSLIYLKG